jgi:hypothetical protein
LLSDSFNPEFIARPGINNSFGTAITTLDMDSSAEMLRQIHISVNHYPLPWRGEIYLQERDRLEFEVDTGDLPLDIYSITLELERDDVTQGIPVEWNVRRPNNKVSTREWQQKMQEEQYAGDCSVTLLYRGVPVPGCTANIQFQVTRLAQQHYEYMREVLKEQNEQVLFSKRGRTHELAMLYNGASPAAVRYQVVHDHYEKLMVVLPYILDQPHHELKNVVTTTPANTIKALNYASVKLAARNGSQWITVETKEATKLENKTTGLETPPPPTRKAITAPLPSAPLSAWQEKLQRIQSQKEKSRHAQQPSSQTTRLIPSHVPLQHLEKSYDNYENRFLKMTIQKLIELARLVEVRLQDEIRVAKAEQLRSSRTRGQALLTLINKNSSYIADMRRMRDRLHDMVHGTFLEKLGKVGPRRTSVVLRENRYYRRVRQLEAALEDSIEVVASTVGLEKAGQSVRLSSVNQLYEYWVTVVTLQTLVERLGFTVVAKEGRPLNLQTALARANSHFNYILQAGGSMELISPMGRRVVVYYDHEYMAPHEQAAGSSPMYYGFYAPVGMGTNKRKPDIAIEVFDEEGKVPKIVVLDATYSRDPRTLYAKYQYRDSIRDYNHTDALSGTPARIVTSSWVVYPDYPERLEHDEFRYGQLPLQPGPNATDQMAQVLRQLLRIAGALE